MCGPVISEKQRERVTGYIKKGVEEGATALVGGPDAPTGFDKGYFVRPTLFTDVDNSMTIAQEEIFGPVLSRHPLRRRGRRDPDRQRQPLRVGRQRDVGFAGAFAGGGPPDRAGFMGVNGGAPYGADTPFGGYKASGVGRQNGVAGFDQYTEIKSVGYPAG